MNAGDKIILTKGSVIRGLQDRYEPVPGEYTVGISPDRDTHKYGGAVYVLGVRYIRLCDGKRETRNWWMEPPYGPFKGKGIFI